MKQLKIKGVIKDSQFFVVSVFLVKKPEDQWQMVMNNTKFNQNVEPNRFSLPKTHIIYDTLMTATYFLSMDINQAFFQQLIVPEDREYTSFVTYEWLF